MFVSLWHFSNKVRAQSRGPLPLEEAFESFCRGVSAYGPFWEHVLGYWKESLGRPEKVMFIKFEDMKMKPSFYLKKIAEFLGCPFSNEEESKGMVDNILNLCSFEKLSNLEVNKTGRVSSGIENKAFFRRGQVGDWKNLLPTEMIEQLNTITENKLVKHGLSFLIFELFVSSLGITFMRINGNHMNKLIITLNMGVESSMYIDYQCSTSHLHLWCLSILEKTV